MPIAAVEAEAITCIGFAVLVGALTQEHLAAAVDAVLDAVDVFTLPALAMPILFFEPEAVVGAAIIE